VVLEQRAQRIREPRLLIVVEVLVRQQSVLGPNCYRGTEQCKCQPGRNALQADASTGFQRRLKFEFASGAGQKKPLAEVDA
jgi:hypothetical protein